MENKWIKKILGLVALLPMLALATACNGVDQSAVSAATTYTLTGGVCYVSGTSTVVSSSFCGVSTTTTSGYTLTGGVCYVTGTSSVVDSSYCGTTSTYTWSGGVCYIAGTSTVVNTSYCGSSTTTTTTGSLCLGYYYHPAYGWGVCNGQNCRAMYLYNQSGQVVWCP